ncbi:hypothetical protein OPV22_023043 [Ensete ventricosum]|uniref:Uncharacterized protein n=1 Tax=Ensete ventricosum TaxID=4639 RepID=A0AAV8PCC5_ENSVE|nr:hypothetical protein OPV22_023043 [Ensete ventricosum]
MATSDAPFMVAHKKGPRRHMMCLNDDSWSQDMFDLVSDSTSKTWERLDDGSSASHSFIVESKAKGMFHGSPAVIKFHIPTKAALQEAYYTPIQPLDVLADKPPEKKFECVRYPHMPAFICYTLVVSFVLSLTNVWLQLSCDISLSKPSCCDPTWFRQRGYTLEDWKRS